MAKDRMLGTTLINGWTLCFSCLIACSLCWAIAIAVRETVGWSGFAADGTVLAIIFVLILLLQLMEIPLTGKKFASSIIPLLILELKDGMRPQDIWWFMFDTLIGAGCAIVGNVLPPPIDSSTLELQRRLRFCAHSTTSLLADLFKAWQYQSCFSDVGQSSTHPGRYSITDELLHHAKPNSPKGDLSLLDRSRLLSLRREAAAQRVSSWTNHYRARKRQRRPASESSLSHMDRSLSYSHSEGDTVSSVTSLEQLKEVRMLPWRKAHKTRDSDRIKRRSDLFRPENKHWRRLRLTLMTVVHFRLNSGAGLGWYFNNNSCGTKFLRVELVAFLREGVEEVAARVAESQFASLSPLRRYLSAKYDKYAALLRDALNIATILEQKIGTMEEAPELNYIYHAFHSLPAFRHALSEYVGALGSTMETIADCLVACDKDQLHPVEEDNPFILRCMTCAATLLDRQAVFDEEYYRSRLLVYYSSTSSNGEARREGGKRRRGRQKQRSIPFNSEVLMNMNSFLFMAAALSTLLTEFWTPAELVTVQARLAATRERGEAAARLSHLSPLPCPANTAESAAAEAGWWGPQARWRAYLRPSRWTPVSWREVWRLVPVAMSDLLPSQTSAIAGLLPCASPALRHAALVRLRAGLAVAVAMTLASAYGIYLNRTTPFLAAFTIAFLTGGQAVGATMITSLNRAAGTVVACVWAMIVQLILENVGSPSGASGPSLQQRLIIGFAVVLFQFPATVVRSYPLQGYAGTCASFTVCILLFAPVLSVRESTDRIVDTFVGVVIYLAVESSIFIAYTEGAFLHHMQRALEGISERFTGFEHNFVHYNRRVTVDYGADGPPMMVSIDLDDDDAGGDPIADGLRELDVGPVTKRIKAQKGLLRYVEMEPSLNRPPVLPTSVLAECVELQAQAVRHLQVMFWAVQCVAERSGPYSRAQRLWNRYRAISGLIVPASPRPSRQPSWQGSGRASRRASRHASRQLSRQPSDGTAQSSKHAALQWGTSQEGYFLREDSKCASWEDLAHEPLGGATPGGEASGKVASSVSSADPEPVLLYPLEQSLTEVGRYATLVVSFLTLCIHDLERGLDVGPGQAYSSRNTLDNIVHFRSTRCSTDYHWEFLRHFASAEELQSVAGDGELLAKLEMQNVIALMSRFQAVLALLLREVVDSEDISSEHAQATDPPRRTPRRTKEVKVVNTMISSSVDLMRALRGLALAVSTLRAHRDIHLTQTGTKFL